MILLLEYGPILVERYKPSNYFEKIQPETEFPCSKNLCWSTFSQKKPTQRVSIRAIETVRYRIMEKKSKDLLDEIEESKAFFQVYEGAVYMNQGRTYLVTSLDTKEKIALCEFSNVDYYTRTRDYTDIHLTGGNTVRITGVILCDIVLLLCVKFITKFMFQAYAFKAPKNQLNKTTAQTHTCRVTTHWLGFYRIRKSNKNVIDDVDLTLPNYSYQSQVSL